MRISKTMLCVRSRRATTVSLLPWRGAPLGRHDQERRAQKPVTRAGAQLGSRNAWRELYQHVCTFVGRVLSPLLANLGLDEVDQEWEKRGHRFVRDADEGNLDVRSARAGARVLARVTRDLKRQLKRVVKAAKSAVDRPWRRTFLGFSCTARQPNRRQVSAKALKAFKRAIRRLTPRPRGVSLLQVVCDVRRYVPGWDAYCSWAEATSVVKALDSWVRRRLRGYVWKPWGRRGYRELVHRGVSRDLAWNP
jgi:RNA-directed DNA polymerase